MIWCFSLEFLHRLNSLADILTFVMSFVGICGFRHFHPLKRDVPRIGTKSFSLPHRNRFQANMNASIVTAFGAVTAIIIVSGGGNGWNLQLKLFCGRIDFPTFCANVHPATHRGANLSRLETSNHPLSHELGSD